MVVVIVSVLVTLVAGNFAANYLFDRYERSRNAIPVREG